MRRSLAFFLLLLLSTAAAAQRPDSLLATRLEAVQRHGQTFLTWTDADTANAKAYRVLRHTAPITPDNVDSAITIAPEVKPGSAADYISAAVHKDHRGFVIDDRGAPMNPDAGLYVHTVGKSGAAAYAVVSLNADGQPIGTVEPGKNSLEEPVSETLQPAQPVFTDEVRSRDGVAHVYTHWVDESMHPREGMAYRFAVALRDDHTPEERPALLVVLHGAGGRYGTLPDSRPGWVRLYPDMRNVNYHSDIEPSFNGNGSNFWFGLNTNFYDKDDPFGGINVNYGERRVLWTIRWVMQRYNIDPDRVHIQGGSMGGYGSLSIAMRNPDLFASVYAMVPPVDFHRMSDYANRIGLANWGPFEDNILTNEGIGIFDRADLVRYVKEHPEVDFPLILTLHGKQDDLITWQGAPLFFDAMQNTRHGLIAVWGKGTHAGPTGAYRVRPDIFDEIDVRSLRRNESYPAVSNASTNDDPGRSKEEGAPEGQLNAMVEWLDSVDLPYEYAVTLRPRNGRRMRITADVTPRRLQRFCVDPGDRVDYRILDLGSGSVLKKGSLTADQHGLITVERVAIVPDATRLFISRR